MPIDPNIILGIRNPQEVALGYEKLVAAQQQNQADQQAQQTQNQLRQLLAQPDAIDTSTGLPSVNTLAKISRLDPATGAKLAGEVSQIQERKAQQDHVTSETVAARQKANTEALSESLALYDADIKSGNVSPEIADQGLRKRLRDHIYGQAVSEGEKEKLWGELAAMPAEKLRVLATSAQQRQAQEKFAAEEKDKADAAAERLRHDKAMEGAADKRLNEGKWEVLDDPKTNTSYRYNPATGEATTLDGKPYTPQGASKIGGGSGIRSAIGMALQKYVKENPKASASDIADFAAQYTAGVREQGAVGTKRGQIEFSAAEVDEAAKVSKEAYSHLTRGQFLPFNKLRESIEQQTSSPEQAAAFAADNALVNGYGALASRGGVSTVSAQDHARAMLNTAQSPEAHNAVVDKMITEGAALSRGGEEATRIARSHHLEMDPSHGAKSGGVQEPKNKADYDALGKGDHYRKPGDPPGTYRVKP